MSVSSVQEIELTQVLEEVIKMLQTLTFPLEHFPGTVTQEIFNNICRLTEANHPQLNGVLRQWAFDLLLSPSVYAVDYAFQLLHILWTPQDGETLACELQAFVDQVQPLLNDYDCLLREWPLNMIYCRSHKCKDLLAAVLNNHDFIKVVIYRAFNDLCLRVQLGSLRIIFALCLHEDENNIMKLLLDCNIVNCLKAALNKKLDDIRVTCVTAILCTLRSTARKLGPNTFSILCSHVNSTGILTLIKKFDISNKHVKDLKPLLCDDFEGPFDSHCGTGICHCQFYPLPEDNRHMTLPST